MLTLESPLLITQKVNEIKTQDKTIILDGAHNPQKMQAFVSSLVEYYPDSKFALLLAFKKGKDVNLMLDEILKYKDQINTIILSRFDGIQDTQLESQNVKEIQEYLTNNGFDNVQIIEDLQKAYDLIKTNPEKISVITGSLYLISAIKELDQKAHLVLN